MTYWQTPHFKAMQRAWYMKLRRAGFLDAEEMIGEEMLLKQSAAHPYQGADELKRTTQEEYFRVLSQRVADEEFQSEVDELILRLFADGMKIVKIGRELEERGQRRCRVTIRVTIRRYEMMWGLRQYSPRELNQVPSKKQAKIA